MRAWLAAVGLFGSSWLWAHGGGHDTEVHAELDPLPAAMRGMQVQLADTLGAQLLIENPTSRTLVISGRDGKPFLRLGPTGVEANLRHPDWLNTWLPGGLPGREPRRGEGPDWQPVRQQPAWGWFDARLKGGREGARWQIPVRIDDQTAMLSGRFVASSQPGYWRAEWRERPALPAGLQIMLVPGQPYGVMLENRSGKTVTVLDPQGQPFLRLVGNSVEARPGNPYWQQLASQQALRQDRTGRGWQRIGSGQRYTWVEPRTRPKSASRADVSWALPLLVDNQPLTLQGRSRWEAR